MDPDIKWEQTRAVNVGLDFGFANQRITGAIDYYDKLTADLLFTVPVAAFSNLSNFLTTNIGSMRNYGVEFSLGARILDGGERGLSWQADFTAARNKNNLRSITPFGGSALSILVGEVSGGVGTRIQVLTPDHPVNSFYVYEHKRENGQPIYRDVDGDTDIDNQRRPVRGPERGRHHQPVRSPAVPRSRAEVDPGPFLLFRLGQVRLRLYAPVVSRQLRLQQRGLDQRQLPRAHRGSSPYNLHSSVLETQFATQQLQSDFYVQNASFLRMDNMTLGYTFNMRGQAARVFGTVQNLFTITGYDGVDPAANIVPPNAQNTSTVNGIDNNIYPRSRTFSAGLSLTL